MINNRRLACFNIYHNATNKCVGQNGIEIRVSKTTHKLRAGSRAEWSFLRCRPELDIDEMGNAACTRKRLTAGRCFQLRKRVTVPLLRLTLAPNFPNNALAQDGEPTLSGIFHLRILSSPDILPNVCGFANAFVSDDKGFVGCIGR